MISELDYNLFVGGLVNFACKAEYDISGRLAEKKYGVSVYR